MMVGKNRGPDSSGLTWGSLNAGFIAGSFGSLSSSGISFMIGAARYDITTISMPVRTEGFRLLDVNFSDRLLPGPVKAALQLHSCGETRDFSAADIGNGTYYRWLDVETTIDFSLYATREIALSLPANNPATGAPVIVSDIAGMAQVGRTLTASAGMVADADGRPSALNYKWFQVDSSNVETEIDSATGTTYTPITADLGHRLKVKTSFYDNLGSEEVRDSLETSTVEQPTLMTIAEATATEGSALTFDVTLSPATDRAVTVNWAVSTSGAGNTASTNDLTGTTSGRLTFAANETSQTITLNTVQDEIYEGDETFTVTLSGPSNAVLGTDSAATGTIVNDEALPTVTLVLADDTIRESDDPNQQGNQHRTTVTATLDIAIEGTLRVTIDSGPALHFPPGDLVRTRLAIPPLQKTSDSLIVQALDNDVDEPDRTAVITVFRARIGTGYLLGRNDFHLGPNPSLTITDDDEAPTVTLMLAPASVRESDDTSSADVSEHVSTVTASLSHPSSEATTVTVTAAAVSPAVAGDFTLSGNKVLTIPARETWSTGTVTVTANDNNVDAADKAVTVSGAAANTHGIAGNPPDVTATIRDDEATPKVALELGATSIDENAGSTTVKATIPHPSSHETVVTITPAPDDFTVGGTLTIPAGQTESGTVTLTAVDNETDAEDKTVTVLATAANGHGIVNPDGVQLTIEDDDPAPVVTLVLTSSPIREKDESGTPGVSEHVATVTAVLDRPSSKPTTVTVSAAAVSPAVAGDFALSTNRTLAIAAGQTASTGTVTIRANDNNVDAPDKEVTVSGTAVNTQGITPPAVETLTISDDEPPPIVTLTLSKTATDEDDSTVITVTASLSHPSSEGTTITVSADAVAPAVSGDFTLTGDTLTISAGQTASTGTVTIAPVDNETDAPDKTVTVSAAVVNTQGHAPGTPADLTLTIRDDDPAPVASLVLTPASIDENGGSTAVTARLDRPSSEDTTIDVSTAAVSPAVAGDFTQTGTMLTVAAGSQDSTGTVTIAAVDNRTDAPDKAVTVSASADNTQGVRATAAGTDAATANLTAQTLAIEDDDLPPTVTLVLAESTIRESDDDMTPGVNDHQTTVTATLSHPSSEQTTVTITAAPGDFTLSANGVLTIPAGDEESSAPVTLTAVDDDTDAPDKHRTVLATAVNGRGSGHVIQPDPVDLTIEDDEPPPTVTLHLGANSNTIGENNGSTTVTARLSHPSSAPTTVTVSAAAVAPALAADFTISGTVLSIPAGMTQSGMATIRAVDNETDAPDKQVTVSATVVNGKLPAPGYELGTPVDVVLTIADDEPPPMVTLRLSSAAVTENGGEAAVTATLSHPSSEATVVTVSTAAVSPAAAGDFTQTGPQLTVPAGLTASTGTVTIRANDNDIDTANKRVTVSATAANVKLPAPGVAGNPPNVTLTIEDDDTRGIALTPATLVLVEGLTSVPSDSGYTVALTSEPTGPVTVTVTGAGGLTVATASNPQASDFAASKTLTFTASSWQTAQTVTLRAGADSNTSDNNYTIGHRASGGDYGSVRGSLPVRVLDAQKSGATLVLTVDRAEIPEGGGAAVVTVTATLGGTEPGGIEPEEYSVALSVAAGTAATTDFSFSQASFRIGGLFDFNETFQTTAQMTITPVNDGLDETDETVLVTATVTPALPDTSAATVVPAVVRIVDDDTRGVTVTPVQLELGEGGSRGYTVELDSQPTGPVTVTPSKTGDGDISFVPASLTFTDTDWQVAQTVTVSAAEDGDPLDDQATVTHAVSGADYGSNNVRAASVQVTAADNERRGVIVSPRDLDLAEGGTGTYTVKLNTLPTGTVTVRPVATGDPDVSVVPASLTFTTLNWNTEQTVTVSAAEDADVDDDRASISHTVTGADYGSNNVPGPEVLVTATDSGQTTTTGTISVSHDAIREASGTRSFKVTVTLDGPRAMDTPVTVLTRGGTASVNDFTASPAAFSLLIPAGSLSAQRTISLYASPDNVVEGDETILVEASAPELTFPNAQVTITDDDMRGVIVSTPSLRMTEQGRDASYTVKLGSQPTGAVTVTATVAGDDDVTVEPPSLSFTALNWNRTQTVTVRALADPDGDDETATISHEAAGADYDGLVGQSVSVTVDDDDQASRKVALSLSPDRVGEDAGSETVTVTAALDGAARAGATEVQVTVTGNTAQAVTDFATVQPFTVTIPEGEMSATGTFSFAPVNDSIDEGDETVTVGGTVAVTGFRVDAASLLLVDDDDRGVTASLLAVTVDEEGSQTYTLVLDTQPTGAVTVTPSVSGNRDVTVSPASLTFTVSNWNTAQTVTVSAAADDDAVDDTASVRHSTRGADYGSVRVDGVAVTVRDNDEQGVTVDPTSVQLREGGRATYTVVLDTQPTGTVTIRPSLAGGSDSDVRVSPSALSFSTSNWKTPKTVTVSAGEDGDSDQDNATVEHAVSGADYGEEEVDAPRVSVTVTDNDVPSTAVVLRLSTDTVGEGGGRTEITVTGELDASPREDTTAVTLDLEGVAGSAEEGVDFAAIDPVILSIPAGRTSATARVPVEPVRDDIDEGDGETLRLAAQTDSGLVLRPSSFDLTIVDDDEKGIVLSRTSLTVREEGSQTYTVRLKSEPTGSVTVTLASRGADGGEVTPRPQQLEFTVANWRTAQTVTVEAAADPDGDDGAAEIVHEGAGGDYGGVAVTLPVRVDDNDQTSRSVQLSLSPDRVEEDAGSETVTVTAVLNGAARSTDTDVAVRATGGTATAGTDFTDFGTVTVRISADRTEGTQSFSFSPVDDYVDEGLSETVVLGGTVQGLTVRTATLTIADNDGRGIELPEGPLTLDEGDNAAYVVSLATEPTGTVTVRVTVSGDRDVSVDPGTLTFTASDWDTAQTVTVAAAQDDDAVADTAELRHSASGADYGGVRALPLAVEVRDNDEQGVTVDPTSVQLREGGRVTYTVVLDTRPTGTVTIRPSLAGGSDSDVRVSPSALSFSTSNWKTPKTVTVSAGEDGDSDPDNATVEHAVSGADYGEEEVDAPRVSVTVTDNDVPSTAVVLRLSTDTVGEGGGRTEITVTGELDAAPREDATAVTLDLEGAAGGAEEGADFTAIDPVILSIPAGRTSATARVPVEPVNDGIDEGAGEALWLVAQTDSGLDLRPSSSFGLTIEDDDEKGIVLSRTSLTVREEGSQTYTVRLKSEPTGSVTVTLASQGADGGEVTPRPQQLEFTVANWRTAQTVTVEAAADPDGDDGAAEIVHEGAGGDYGGVAVTLPVRVDDNDQTSRSVQLSLSPDRVEEDAGSETVTVTAVLNGAARSTDTDVAVRATGGTATAGTDFTDFGTVTVRISADRTEGTQSFSFSPVDDYVDEGLSETVVLGGTVQGLTVRTATLTIADNDGRGIELPEGPLLTLDEGDNSAYIVSLGTEPTGTVTVRVTVSGDRDVSVDPGTLTFTASDWDTAQTVTVAAAQDDDAVADIAELRHSASGADYGGVGALPLAVEVRDNDEQGVTVDPTSVQLREGGRATYTVVLDTQPTGTVTIRPSLADGSDSDVRVSPSALSFSTSNWKTPKTVTVSAGEDGDSDPDNATVEHAVSGADYGAAAVEAPWVSVTVTDDDVPSTAVVLRLSTDTVGEGGGRTEITVTGELDASPREDATAVTLDLEGAAGGAEEGADFTAIDPVILSIPAGRTSATARVPVEPVNDGIDEGAGEALWLVAQTDSGLDLRPSSSFGLTIEDDDEKGIVLSRTSLTVREEGSQTYTVRLKSEPTGSVTVTLASQGADGGEVTPRPQQLEFTVANWRTAQTVTVEAAADPDGDDGAAEIVHEGAGGDYGGVAVTLPVRVDDNDQTSRSVQLSLSPDRVEEDAGSETVTVTAVLNGAARSTDTDVAVRATGGTATAGTDFTDFGTVTVRISADRTEGTQSFSFSPVDDYVDEGLSETVVLGGTVQGLTVRTATLTIADNDGRGIELPEGPLLTLDEGDNAAYVVSLGTEPTGTVTVRVTVSGDRDVSVDPGSLTFTASDWDTAQTVTVAAAQDDDAVADIAELRHSASGADYGGVGALPLAVEVRDNDEQGVTVDPTSVQLREGGRATYTVVLDTQPTGTVTIRPSLADGSDSDVRVSPSALSFSTSNWKTPKTVTVSAGEDGDSDQDNATVEHAVSGADYGEEEVDAPRVSVLVTDDDVPSTAVVLRLSTDTVGEGGGRTEITVTGELDASPREDTTAVTLDLEGVAGSAEEGVDFAAIDPVILSIPAGRTSATARVPVEPVRDDIDEGDGETLRLAAQTDSGLVLRPSSFDLTIVDDDEKGIVLSRTSLTVREEGSQTYTVRLKSEPTGSVTVTLASRGADGGEVTPRPQQLEFTVANWRTAQTVTVEAAADPDGDDGAAEIVHEGAGGDYGGVAVTLPVRVDDNDQTSRSVQLSLSPDRVEEDAGSETVTVTAVLNGAARSTDTDVAVRATGGTATAGTDFTDFGTVTVRISADRTEGTQSFSFSPVDDYVDEGLSETVVLGGTVQGLTVRTATLTIADNDGRGIELPEGPLTLDEGDNAAYVVSLATEPTGTVTVRVRVSGDRDVSVDPGTLTFTASDWDTAQTVTVAAAQDDDAVADIAELRHSASGADYGGVGALPLAVEVREDDTRGVTISSESVQLREGGRATYTVVLDTQPTGTVTIRPSLADGSDSDVRVSPSALSFSTSNWKTPKTVTVSAGEDGDSDPDNATVEHAVSGADYGAAAVSAPRVSVTVTDDDVPSTAVVLRLSTDTVGEGGGRTEITVTGELDASPRADATAVVLDLEGVAGSAEEGADFTAIQPVTLTIAAGRTSATARVSVTPVNDDIDEGDGETLRLVAQTASGLVLQPSSFDLTIVDDDEREILLSRTSLTVREEGSQTYTVRLKSQPTGNVTVALASQGAGAQDLTFAPAQLAFTANDWNTAQTVTVSAAGDPDSDDETATIAHAASGGDYDSLQADLPATVLDKTGGPRATGIAISPAPPAASEEHGPRYTKEGLLALPDGAVHGPGATLTFTLTFDTAVTVTPGTNSTTNSPTRPELAIDLLGGKRLARYTGPVGTPTDTMVFTWTVSKGDYDPDGLHVLEIALNGATIRDSQDRDTAPETIPAERYKAHRVRGGFFAMWLVVSGSAREGDPFTVKVQRGGGYNEPAHAIVQMTDSGVKKLSGDLSNLTPEELQELQDYAPRLRSFPFDEASRKAVDPKFSVGTVTPPDDGEANDERTLTFELIATDVGAAEYSYWYDTREPVEVTVPVVDNATDAPSLSVGPADAFEVPDATLSFEVRLDPASGGEVAVDYATRDGTAVAGADYVRTSGTLTFAAGETVKTVEVPVLQDAHDEGVETVWLVLSNPRGAVIARGENWGQIHNSGTIPKAWIARFGRTVAEQALEAVEGRMRGAPAPGVEIALAGVRIESQPEPGSEAEREARRDAQRLADWLKGETDPEEAQRRSRAVTSRDLLTGSAFALTAETAGKDLVSLWGRGAVTRFDGREGKLTLDGEVVTGMLGADWSRGRWTAGLIVSHSSGEGGYSNGSGTDTGSGSGTGGKVEATLTGLFPWARHALSERLEAWGAAGYGAGEFTVTLKHPGTDEDGVAFRADLDLRMAAAGLRGTILDGGGDGLTLTGKTDAMAVQTASGRGRSADGHNLEPARATVTRLRLGLEASRPVGLGGGATLTPSLMVGVRHDGGDAETGFGLELGGGLALSDPQRGLQAELRGRGLLAHQSKGFRDLGFSGSLAWEAKPSSDRGAKLRLTQTIGGSFSGGADAFLSRGTLEALAANDNGEGGNDELKSRRLELKFGYGLPAFGDRFTWTPEVGIGLSDTGRDYSLGWRLVRGGSDSDGVPLELSFEARRRESANDDTPPEHEVGLRLTWRF